MSRAGAPSRVDFVLKAERIVIEAKIARPGHLDKKIGEELAIDVRRYKSHPDCGTLVFFVYDPKSLLKNPAGLADLEKDTDLTIRVIVQPK